MVEAGGGGDSIPALAGQPRERAAPVKTFQLQILHVGHRHWKTTTACLNAYIALPSLPHYCRSAVFAPLSAATEYQASQSQVPSRLSRTADSVSANHGPLGWLVPRHMELGKPGKPGQAMNAVRLGRSKSQPQSRGGCLKILSNQFVSPGPAVTLQICYHSLAIVFLDREKTALHPRNSLPLAAVCRTNSRKADFGVRVVPSIARLRRRTRSQLI
jgi:hypothetical protein